MELLLLLFLVLLLLLFYKLSYFVFCFANFYCFFLRTRANFVIGLWAFKFAHK
jgi:hypothetical protein